MTRSGTLEERRIADNAYAAEYRNRPGMREKYGKSGYQWAIDNPEQRRETNRLAMQVYRSRHPGKILWRAIQQGDKASWPNEPCLTFEEYEEIVAPMICSYTGLPLSWNTERKWKDLQPSLDRIDNARGHAADNVRLTCLRVNLMRGNLPVEEFVRLCRLVTENAK